MVKKVSVIAMALALCVVFGYSNANAVVNVTRGGIGDALVYDLFDIRDTSLRSDLWQNYFVIENTSGNWTAAHLRFRSWKKSIEIWDHVILLSPRDVFWCVVQKATVAGTTSDGKAYEVGDPIIWSNDTETLLNSGLIYPPDTAWVDVLSDQLLKACGWTDQEIADQQLLEAGYLEAIGLWELSVPGIYGPAGSDDTHNLANVVNDLYRTTSDTGVINVYDVLEAAFYNWTTLANKTQEWPITSQIAGFETGGDGQARDVLDCSNSLAGALERGDLTSGRYEMGNFLALQDFRTTRQDDTPDFHRDGSMLGAIVFPVLALDSQPYNVGFGVAPNGQNAVLNAWYVNESYSSTNGPGWRDGDNIWQNNAGCGAGINPFNDIWSLDDVERALQVGNVWNHFYNEHDGVDYWTDLVVTFPTKHYHWLFINFPFWNDGGVPTSCVAPGYPNEGFYQQYADRMAAYRATVKGYLAMYDNGPVGAYHQIWNMEEESINPPPPIPSPREPDFDNPIPHECNIILVGDDKTQREGYGELIHEADPVLYTEWPDGQFTIGPFVLQGGERGLAFVQANPHPIYGYNMGPIIPRYYLPPVMEIVFTHYFGGDVAIRSTSTPVKFDFVYELVGQYLTPQPWNW